MILDFRIILESAFWVKNQCAGPIFQRENAAGRLNACADNQFNGFESSRQERYALLCGLKIW